MSQMRQVGEAALAANTPLHIAHKAAIVLGWPLAADRPSTAVSLVLLSLLVPVLAALQFGRNLVAGRGLPGPWLQFCLLLSALTVGTALAIQLGRVIEQPNYAHGPSYERYATIAALYWCSLFGLMLAWLSRQPAVAQACGLGLLLALGWVLATPAGDYLKQEIDSLQVAGRLYAAGETPSLRGRSGNNPSRFKPEYIFSFDDLFRARGAAYTRPTRFPAVDEQAPDCRATGVSLSAAGGKRAKRLHLTATVTNSSFFLVRDILVADRGQLVARLVPHNQGDAVAVQLLARDDTAWEGRADIPRSLPPSLQLILTLPAGLQLSCQMPTEGLVPAPATVETMTDV